jgi:hypothetical protein
LRVTDGLGVIPPGPVRTIRLIRVAPEFGHPVSIAARATAWCPPRRRQVA